MGISINFLLNIHSLRKHVIVSKMAEDKSQLPTDAILHIVLQEAVFTKTITIQ